MLTVKPGEKLDILLADRGVSQSELARRVGVPQPTVNRWINGKGRMYADQAFAVCRALEVAVDWLLDEAVDSPPSPAMTDRERRVAEIVAEIGPDLAWRRLIRGEAEPRLIDPPTPAIRREDAG